MESIKYMTRIHELITTEIQETIRSSVEKTGLTPDYSFVIHEDGSTDFVEATKLVIPENQRAKFVFYITSTVVLNEGVDNYLHWLSGVIFGILTYRKSIIAHPDSI